MSKGKTICTVCNYIYDEALGVPSQTIAPFTKFEELPDGWRCPECASAKEMFQSCSCVSLHTNDQSSSSSGGGAEIFSKLSHLAEVPIGQLVAEEPDRACVFEQFGLDYCCGGKMTLKEACAKKGVSIEEVLEKIYAAGQYPSGAESDWTKTSLKELIDHIVTRYHRPLSEELPRLSQLIEKVARVHGSNHPEMIQLANVFKQFRAELELHMQKEELILFPGIAGIEAGGSEKSFGCGGGVEHPIQVMTMEHDDAGEALAKMRRLTNNYTPPADACNTFKVLLHSLAKLELDTHQHVHKENNILFPRTIEITKSKVAPTCK